MRRLLVEHPYSFRVVHHNYPRMRCSTLSGPLTCQYARAANCAGDQGKFWEADSWLFEHAPGKVTIDFTSMPTDLALDAAKFSACLEGQASYDRADAEALAASRAHIIDAPSYLLDGKKFIGGSILRELMKRL
jgi:protein-disulfide isomerase